MTNYDRIKVMSVEEMAKELHSIVSHNYCPAKEYCDRLCKLGTFKGCKKTLIQWLESEVEGK